ncbi:hypothetical protein HK100_011689 [Physocladia obscura]|uniref:Uncharacterized protein n=1 Tax=Physocladia obscura TaxID=109957 RepID=A0AAD5T6U6_9FUNG|nr:hypothetical protein HK100_011689 [Physocladia obscura]
MDCVVTLPNNALTATGLSTPWAVTGCDQTVNPTFAECVSVDPATGALGVYSPLLINSGSTNFVTPTVPKLPANAVVGCWFGTNGATTTLAGATTQANCTSPGVQLGQFAACNAPAFFAVANKKSTIPALGTGLNGKPCYTIRSFEIIDMDQSDNVVTSFLQDPNTNKLAQTTVANQKALPNATEITNGSDNLLLDGAYRPALGCTAFTTSNLADPTGSSVGALALNELQAKKLQAPPAALVPDFDPFVVTNAAPDLNKQKIYRASVNQPPPPTVTTNEQLTYCQHMLNITAPGYITDLKFLTGKTSPAAANGIDLFTFLAQRFAASWAGLTCNTLIPVTDVNGQTVAGPITANFDANGVCISATFNTPSLVKLLLSNGGPTTEALALSSTATTTTVTTTTTTTTTTATTTSSKTKTKTTTTAAIASTTTTSAAVVTGGATGTVTTTVNVNSNPNNANCGGPSNSNLLLYMGTTLSVKASGITNTACTNGPMAECGLPTIQGSVFFAGNNSAVEIVAWTGGNQQFSGNTFQITEEDDMPYYGGTLVLNLPCSYNPATFNSGIANQLGFSFVTLNSVVATIDNAGNNVNANVVVVIAGATTTTSGTGVVTTTTTTTAAGSGAVATTTTTAASAASAGSIVLTLAGENNGAGVTNIQCNQGVLSLQVVFQASINVDNIHAYQPMAELGLPTVSATFSVNGAAPTLTQQNAFNVQSSSVSGATWTFLLQDDGPHPGGQFTLGACTAGTTPTVLLTLTSGPITDAQGLPNGADGGPAVPLVNGPVTVVNALPAEFNGGAVNNGATTGGTPVATTTTSIAAIVATTTTTAAVAASTSGSIVLTLAGENDGAGVTSIQCNQGVLSLQVVFQASINVDNIHAYQPMAELGLPTVSATFSVNGAAPTLTQQNAFNVQSSSVSGATWTFLLQDDGPHPGGQFTLGACTAGTTPTVLLTLTSGPITDAQGLPNGADGGPAVPLVNGPVTVVNALPAEFNGGAVNNGATTGGTPVATTTTTTTAAVATTTTTAAAVATTTTVAVTGGATGTVTTTVSVKANPNNANCGGPSNSNLLLYMGTSLSVKATGIANTACTNGPMAECGLPTIQGSVFFTANNSAVDIVSWTGGNQQFTGNTFQIAEEDDMPYYGGTLVLNLPCSYNPATFNSGIANQLGFSFVTLNSVVATIDNAGNNVNANVVVTSVA